MKLPLNKKDNGIYIDRTICNIGYEILQHFYMEILYVTSGVVEMSINNVTSTLTVGDIAVIFPYSTHSMKVVKESEISVVMFNPTVADSFEKKLFSCRPVYPYIKNGTQFFSTFEKLERYSKKQDIEYLKLQNIYLVALVGELILSLDLISIERTSVGTVQKVLNFCAEHYTEKITTNIVARELYISPSSVTKVFAGKLGTTFGEYINRLRVNKARHYLEKTDKRIVDIMYECGFNNQSTFNRVFQEVQGTTPSKLRKKARN